MKYCLSFLLVSLFTSCKYFDVEKTTSEAILKEELKTFNWNDVDTYPSFSICDSLISKSEKKECFQNNLSSHILKFLQDEVIVVTQDIHDTINLQFKVSEKGDLRLLEATADSLTVKEIPNIYELINNSLNTLPTIYAAIKHDQYVKTEFELPMVIKVE